MSKFEGTPGSWVAIKGPHFWVVEDGNGQRLAALLESERVFTDGIEHDDALANARLIAAAPDMFRVIELIKRRIETCLGDGLEMGAGTMARLLDEANEIIARATGEQ